MRQNIGKVAEQNLAVEGIAQLNQASDKHQAFDKHQAQQPSLKKTAIASKKQPLQLLQPSQSRYKGQNLKHKFARSAVHQAKIPKKGAPGGAP